MPRRRQPKAAGITHCITQCERILMTNKPAAKGLVFRHLLRHLQHCPHDRDALIQACWQSPHASTLIPVLIDTHHDHWFLDATVGQLIKQLASACLSHQPPSPFLNALFTLLRCPDPAIQSNTMTALQTIATTATWSDIHPSFCSDTFIKAIHQLTQHHPIKKAAIELLLVVMHKLTEDHPIKKTATDLLVTACRENPETYLLDMMAGYQNAFNKTIDSDPHPHIDPAIVRRWQQTLAKIITPLKTIPLKGLIEVWAFDQRCHTYLTTPQDSRLTIPDTSGEAGQTRALPDALLHRHLQSLGRHHLFNHTLSQLVTQHIVANDTAQPNGAASYDPLFGFLAYVAQSSPPASVPVVKDMLPQVAGPWPPELAHTDTANPMVPTQPRLCAISKNQAVMNDPKANEQTALGAISESPAVLHVPTANVKTASAFFYDDSKRINTSTPNPYDSDESFYTHQDLEAIHNATSWRAACAIAHHMLSTYHQHCDGYNQQIDRHPPLHDPIQKDTQRGGCAVTISYPPLLQRAPYLDAAGSNMDELEPPNIDVTAPHPPTPVCDPTLDRILQTWREAFKSRTPSVYSIALHDVEALHRYYIGAIDRTNSPFHNKVVHEIEASKQCGIPPCDPPLRAVELPSPELNFNNLANTFPTLHFFLDIMTLIPGGHLFFEHVRHSTCKGPNRKPLSEGAMIGLGLCVVSHPYLILSPDYDPEANQFTPPLGQLGMWLMKLQYTIPSAQHVNTPLPDERDDWTGKQDTPSLIPNDEALNEAKKVAYLIEIARHFGGDFLPGYLKNSDAVTFITLYKTLVWDTLPKRM